MNDYVNELLSDFNGTYPQFLKYVHVTLNKKIKDNKDKHKYTIIQKSIFKYITDNKAEIVKKINKNK
jgi:hypothetical protein